MKRIISLLLISWLLAACSSAPQTASQDVSALSTQAVATVYANLTLSPAVPTVTPTPSLTPLPPTITDKFDVPMVLVPAGPFLMGRDENVGGQPYVEVTIGNYYIDTYEVTNQRYMACVHAGTCVAPLNPGSYTHANYYQNPAFANYPLIITSGNWAAAETYCAWRGAHLSSEIEWEKAALGPDGRTYPWGSDYPDGTRANLCDLNCFQNQADRSMDDGYTDVAPVGSYPAGASPYGVMDMVGNMDEWVSQAGVALHAYMSQPTPHANVYETRGGGWDAAPNTVLNTLHYQHTYGLVALDTGFRCASSFLSSELTPVFKPLRPTGTPGPTHTPAPPTATATIPPAAISSNVYPIAFLSKESDDVMYLHLVNDNGGGLRTLFPLGQDLSFEIRQPTWSPDGNSLYFIGYHSNSAQGVNQNYLYQAEPAETDSLKVYHGVTGLPDLAYEKMSLSPDGRYLALVYTPYEQDKAYWGAGASGIPALGLFDLKTRIWKTLPIPNIQNDYANDICLSPQAWSWDGRQVAFVARVSTSVGLEPGGVALVSSHRGGGYENALFSASTNGTVKRIGWVSDDSNPGPCPIWSANGKQIIFAGHPDSNSGSGDLTLMSIHPDGTQRKGLGDILREGNGRLFRFSPDGLHLAALFSDLGLSQIAINSTGIFGLSFPGEGLFPWEFLGSNAGLSAPAWSPDSSRIAFQCINIIFPHICTVKLDGTGSYTLTGENLISSQPDWSPDGLKIAFISRTNAGETGLYVMNTDGSGLQRLAGPGNVGGDWDPDAFFWSPQAVKP